MSKQNIPFNKPAYTGNEDQYVLDSMRSNHISGNGAYTKKVEAWFQEELQCKKALLVSSCTHALEMAAIALEIQSGDEIIMPSFTFVSSANAFVLRGAKIVFVDIHKDTLNIDETKIEAAITDKTKVILCVHYAGVACEMDTIMSIAKKHNLFVVEDAAQGMLASYKTKALGTIGHFGAFSFHETKNFTSAGEGGLLIINDESFIEKVQIIREKGTNRTLFLEGKVDKYSWVDLGSSFLLSDMSAAYLWGQVQKKEIINDERLASWQEYYTKLEKLETLGFIQRASKHKNTQHNGHIFYIKVKDLDERSTLMNYLHAHNIHAVFHYVPLHSSQAGKKFSRFSGVDVFTTQESARLLRLPLYYGLKSCEIDYIADTLYDFYKTESQK